MPYETRSQKATQKEKLKDPEPKEELLNISSSVKTSTLIEVQEKKDNDSTIKDCSIESTVPAYNTTKKIIIVFDRAYDEIFTNFYCPNGQTMSPMHMLTRGVRIFLHNQNFINSNHEFALILLNENICEWEVDFTKDINEILNVLELIEECETEDVFNMNSVFDTILKHVSLPKMSHITEKPPYIIHTIFFYNRSFTTPEYKVTDNLQQYLESPYFTFDILYTHEIPESNNHCQKIIDIFHDVIKKDKWYFFPVAREAQLLHICIGKLMGHPLQRVRQNANKRLYIKN